MSVFRRASGFSNPKFKQIRDCEIGFTDDLGQTSSCGTKSAWVVLNQTTNKQTFCCSKHLTQSLNKEDNYLVYSVIKEIDKIS